ncbi:MAG: helix-turn-helix transcriptional regulator [Waterburya sp.]
MKPKTKHEERIAIGNSIREKQNQKKLSDKDLAKLIDLNISTRICSWKAGECIPLKYAKKLSVALDIPIEHFPDTSWQRDKDAKNEDSSTGNKSEILVQTINELSLLNESQIKAILTVIIAFKENK